MHKPTTRRKFVAILGSAMGAIAGFRFLPFRLRQDEVLADDLVDAEVFGEFLLLPEDAPLPSMVRLPTAQVPVLEDHLDDGLAVTEVQYFETPRELAASTGFPIYALGDIPDNLRLAGTTLTPSPSGGVFGATVDYEAYSEELASWVTAVSILAREHFPRPVPVHSYESHDGKMVRPMKRTDLLPTSAVVKDLPIGHSVQWVEGGVHYSLATQFPSTLSQTESLVSLLERVA